MSTNLISLAVYIRHNILQTNYNHEHNKNILNLIIEAIKINLNKLYYTCNTFNQFYKILGL